MIEKIKLHTLFEADISFYILVEVLLSGKHELLSYGLLRSSRYNLSLVAGSKTKTTVKRIFLYTFKAMQACVVTQRVSSSIL